ncbi:hypothetical protein H7I01_11810, partial [Mycobacterium palustre]|nr:hypothetical protein [Mycobacterium palustre]
MPTSPVLNPSGAAAFAVTPVVDYEPPRRDVLACRQTPRAPLRRGARAPRRPYPEQPGGHPEAAGGGHPEAAGLVPVTAPMGQGAGLAERAVRPGV